MPEEIPSADVDNSFKVEMEKIYWPNESRNEAQGVVEDAAELFKLPHIYSQGWSGSASVIMCVSLSPSKIF